MVCFLPNLVHQMMMYQTVITQFASQYAFSSVYEYDQLHRMQLANNPTSFRWDVVDDTLFNMYLRGAQPSTSFTKSLPSRLGRCFKCQGSGHFAAQCLNKSTGPAVSPTQFRNVPSKSWPPDRPACFAFNKALPCRPNCSFTHCCHLCQKNQLLSFAHPGPLSSVPTNFFPISSFVNTPVKVRVLNKFLLSHPNRDLVDFIISGFTYGFRLGCSHNTPLTSATRNNKSAYQGSN